MPKIKFLIFILTDFLLLFWLAIPYYSGDVKNHFVWAQSILEYGAFGFYERDFPGFAFPNYPPVAMFLFTISLATYYWIKDLVFFLNSNLGIFPSNLIYFFEWENTKIAFLKLPAIISNISIAIFLYLLFPYTNKKPNRKLKILVLALFLFNPATIYLSSVWGQIDLLPIGFIMFSILLLKRKKIFWAGLLFSLALLSKQTSVIFLPVFLVWILKDFGVRKVFLFFLVNVFSIMLFYLPFHRPSLFWLLDLFRKNFDFVAHSVNENAINFWGFVYNFDRASDESFFGILTFQQWGYLLFFVLMIFPGIVFLKRKTTLNGLFIFLTIVSLSYFFFFTRMHERYLIPTIVFLSYMSFVNKIFLRILVFFSLLHFINLYRGLLQPDIAILNSMIDSLLFLKVLVIGYFALLIYTLYNYVKRSD